jgi:hypothetical protein
MRLKNRDATMNILFLFLSALGYVGRILFIMKICPSVSLKNLMKYVLLMCLVTYR